MLTGLEVKEAAQVLGIDPSTVIRHVKKRLLKANKEGPKWRVFLPGQGCSLCEAAGAVSLLIRCATCNRYYCGFHSVSACKSGQHGQTREVAGV